MKKSKNKTYNIKIKLSNPFFTEEDGENIAAAIGLISLFTILILLSVFIVIPSITQPHYKITKTECHNETINEKVIFPNDFKLISCPKHIKNIPCYDNNGNEILDHRCEEIKTIGIHCWELKNKSIFDGFMSKEYITYSQGGYLRFLWYNKDYTGSDWNFIAPDYLPNKRQTIKEVCGQVEVEEIKYSPISLTCNVNIQGCIGSYEIEKLWEFLIIGKYKVTNDILCPDYIDAKVNSEGHLMMGENSFNFSVIGIGNGSYVGIVNDKYLVPVNCDYGQSILKKELKKEWLDNPENCECINCPCDLEKECAWGSREECNKHCNKYKCGDYQVEVLS